MDGEGEGIVRIPPMEEMFRQVAIPKERPKYYPSHSAKSFLKDFSELNPPTLLGPSHPTTSFRADQMIPFARAVDLKVSLASYSMLEDLLLKRERALEPILWHGVILQEGHFPQVFRDHQWATVLLLGQFMRCRLLPKLRVLMLSWVETCWKNHVLVNRQMLVCLWELKVVKNRELTVINSAAD